MLLALVVLTPVLTPATADFVPSPFTDFPSTNTVGEVNKVFIVNVTNVSPGTVQNPNDDDVTVSLTQIGLIPSCAVTAGTACVTPETGVFDIQTGPAAAVGTAGACLNTTFSVTGPDATGRYTIVPNAPVLLGPSNPLAVNPSNRSTFCTFQMTILNVRRVPTVDVDPLNAEVQTFREVDATIVPAPDPGQLPVNLARTGISSSTALVTVLQGAVTLDTLSTPRTGAGSPAPPNSTATDQATIARVLPGGVNPTGNVTFRLLQNPNADCSTGTVVSGPTVVAIDPVTGIATTPSTGPLTAGAYNWVATYSGDANYDPITVPVGCNDPDERFIIAIPPEIRVDKTANPLTLPEPGGNFTYTVVVTNPSTTVPITITSLTDDVYGNLNTRGTCTTAINTVLAVSPGPGNTYTCSFTAPFTGAPGAQLTDIVTVVGTDALGQTATDTDDATVGITGVAPQVAIVKTAAPLSRPEPGGDFTYTVVVTNPSADEALTITSLNDNVYGNLASAANPAVTANTCTTAVGTVLAVAPGPGNTYTCQFTAAFTGTGGQQLTDIVTVVGQDNDGDTATASDDATVSITAVIIPAITVAKSVTPASLPAPGGTFTFNVLVTNTGPNSVAITSLNDDIYGNIANQGSCTTAVGAALPSGGSYTCAFPGEFTGVAGATETDVVTVTAVDANGVVAADTDDATVTLVNVAPTVQVTKSAAPLSRPEPGGAFTFTAVVTNTSAETVTITSLTDDIYGDLATRPGSTCGLLINTTLAPGASSAPCSFPGNFFGDAGASQIDVVTVVVTDAEGTTATDNDDATVTITDIPPTINIVKTATPLSRIAPGGTFTFTVVITNTSFEPVTITSLVDDVYGDLNGRGTCATGAVLAPSGGTYTCTFPGDFTGVAGASQTDTVTVIGVDNDGTTVTDSDDATVTLTAMPTIRVDKSAEPASLPEPGGTFTFTVVVTNTSAETLTINDLDDDIYGDLAAPRPGSTCNTLIGTTLAPGASSPPCTFTGPFTGQGGASQTDVVTVVGQNAAGVVVTDTDDAIVRITNVVPVVAVTKTATPLTRPAPGGAFTFTVVVSNPGTEMVTITDLDDDIYGDLATRPGSTCNTLIGTTLAPGASSAPCTFTGNFTGAAGAAQTDVVTVTATDDEGTVVIATDDATVSIVNIIPDISVDKTAAPATLPAPGGTFTFTVVVTNTGPNSLTINSLTDDIYGNLATQGTCTTAVGTVLPSGGTYTCSFPGTFTGIGGQSQTDIVTATGQDAFGTVVSDTDDATVTLTNVAPTVQVVKTANPLTLPEPGGQFTFTVVVTNTSAETVTITSLIDNVYGNLATRPGSTCGPLIGTTLAPGASSAPCTFTGNFFGNAGASETDIVTVVVTDAEGTTATDDDDAVVSITDVPPTIDVVKTADPLTLPAPGGTFTFTVTVTNNSFEPVTITALTDNIYGDLNGRGTCAIGATLAANGGTYTCSFPGDFNGPPNASQTDIVTVTAIDEDGTTVTDSDDATVSLVGVPARLRTLASAGTVGSEVYDTATLDGGFNPTGTITFRLFGPYAPNVAPTCTGTPIFTSVKTLPGGAGPQVVESDRFVLPAPGVYVFVATYSGDANNAPVTSACDDLDETIGVGRRPTSLTTDASSNVLLGGQIFDVATITGFNPTGSVRFDLYGPNNADCSGTPVFTSTKAVNGNGNYQSDSFTPSQPGLYRFVATYSGDANNVEVITDCNDPLEQVEVSTVPIIRVDKTATPTSVVAPGGNVVFDVVVTNTTNVALTIRSLIDNVYGDLTKIAGSTCASAVGTVLQPSPGPGNTYSCRFTAPVQGAAGTTHTDIVTVTATDSTGRTVTDDDDAVVTITAVPPTITSTKTATPTSLPEPGGTFTFTFSVTNTGPNPVTITSLVDNIYGDLNGRGTCAVGAVLATNATYTCSFTGNFTGNAGAAQTDIITVTGRDNLGQTVTSQSQATVTIVDVPPSIQVTKSADPASRPAPGGSFRFTVTVTNTGTEEVRITRLVDDIYGDLNGRGSCAIGVVLAPNGGSYRCAFDGEFRGQAGASQTDIVTATAVDNDNTPVTASAKATVTLTPPGTPPVVNPPPPPPPVVQPPIVIQTPPQVLVRTGSELSGPARLAGLLLIVGMTLIAATRRFGEGPGLATVPVGPSAGPWGPGSGGPRGGGGHWFDGGARLRPPRGPAGGSSGGAAARPTLPPAPVPEPASDFDWDGWVSGRRAPAPPVPEPVEVPEAVLVVEPEPVEWQPLEWEPVDFEPVDFEPVVAEEVVAEEVVDEPAVAPEVVEATVATFRSGGGLDAAALDAAAALEPARRPTSPPSRRSWRS